MITKQMSIRLAGGRIKRLIPINQFESTSEANKVLGRKHVLELINRAFCIEQQSFYHREAINEPANDE